MKEEEGVFTYYDERLQNRATFTIKQKLIVPNIFKIKSNYINLNFVMTMGEYVPQYKANIIFNIIKDLCDEFGLFIYNELFENALSFDMNLMHEVYTYFKKVCCEKFPDEYAKYHYVDGNKLSNILNYQKTYKELEVEYFNEEVVVPAYMFLLDRLDGVRTAIKWKEGTKTIFPPDLDYIFYEQSNLETHIYVYSEVYQEIEKFVVDLPGFQRGTKIIDSKEIKKIKKVMKKAKFREINMEFKNIKLEELVDC